MSEQPSLMHQHASATPTGIRPAVYVSTIARIVAPATATGRARAAPCIWRTIRLIAPVRLHTMGTIVLQGVGHINTTTAIRANVTIITSGSTAARTALQAAHATTGGPAMTTEDVLAG